QLLRIDLADVAEHVREQTVLRVTALRLLLDAQGWELRVVRLDPSDVGRAGVLLDGNRLELRQRLYLVEALAQKIVVHAETIGQRLNERVQVLPLQLLAREDDVVDRARVNKDFAVAVEDRAAL